MELFKVCPECGSEFVARVDACIDCGGPLVWADQRALEMQAMSASPASPPAEPSGEIPEDAVPIRQASLSWIDHLARALSDRGIQPFIREEVTPDPNAINIQGAFGHGWYYTLYVRPEDLDLAEEIDKEVYAREMPGTGRAEANVTTGCPACEGFLRSSDTACPSCGLEIPDEAEPEEGPGVETPG